MSIFLAPQFVPEIHYDANLTTPRHHNQMLQIALREAGEYYEQRYIGEHFKISAKTAPGGDYGYRKRTAKYMRQKARKWHHQRPLVWSGEMELRALTTSKVTAGINPPRVRVTTRPIHFLTSHAIRPELAAISHSEVQKIRWMIVFRYQQLLSDPQYMRRRKA